MLDDKDNEPIKVEAYFDSILDLIDDGIYITDRSGKTLKANKAYEEHSGNKREETVGKNVQEIIKEKIFDVALNPEVIKTGKAIHNVIQRNRKGKKVFLNANPVFDESGRVVMCVTFVRDISVLSDLREQIARQEKIINEYQQMGKENQRKLDYMFQSEEMKEVYKFVEKIANTDVNVLIQGETGVGKDILSQRIHERSLRSDQVYFKVDCASIPENLIESELFGYAPGAFSGANTKGRAGFFEVANKGTLFLDEIGELSLFMQSRLLRVLQDKEIMRIGSNDIQKVDVRIISATNRNLEQAVRDGGFRKDLYFRLCGAVLTVPPLRESQSDIIPLANYFLDRFNIKYHKNIRFSKEVEEAFLHHGWPGNIRQMENLIQNLVILEDKIIMGVTNLPGDFQVDKSDIDSADKSIYELIEDFERSLVKNALDKYGSISKAAKVLKVDRTTIFRKAKKYNLR